ncbi:hypothetical protein AALP_AA7G147200 [Arabis alpina]|uniref:Zinc finger PHD-type domain-containing protein n=1 Tax=Arabis alpina TaxID=50452 RepID=A0A087GI36_ARAAL|nr:hypothetical protein AALP_AA7G147200 [Arabis alpina]
MAPVCETCADIGFEEALVYCDSCKLASIHRYCLGITPVPIDDYVTWFCASCVESDSGSDGEQVDKPLKLTHIVEDHDTTIVTASSSPPKETRKESEGNSQELTTKGASVLESNCVPDHDVSSTTSKRKLTFDQENMQLVVVKSPCNEGGESNRVLTLTPNSLALVQYRVQPRRTPIWRGSISLKKGNIGGLVAHLSTIACHRAYATANSLHTCLSAEMFPRLEIWPKSFMRNGGPKDESIALYFVPSSGSIENESESEEGEGAIVDPQQIDDRKNFDSLVLEMKNNDLAMRCILDNAELLLFTSYMLPIHYWSSSSTEYLWGVFMSKKAHRP